MTVRVTTAAILLAAMAIAGDSRQLTRIQFWSMGTSTRIAVEFSGEFQYKAGRLEKPDRIFFDISNTTFALDGRTRGVHAVNVGDKLVKQIRVANPLSTMTRVVLDLEGEALYTAAELKNPNRLIIEVYPPGQTPAPGDKPSVSGDVSVAAPAEAPFIAASIPRKTEIPDLPKPASYEPLASPGPASARVALPAKPNMGGDRSLTRALGLKLKRIVIDPGHGGFDDGTTGHGGLKEKDLVLDVALRLGAMVREKLQAEVVFTRESDQFVDLEQRPLMANEQHADLFLSIHANSSTVRSVTGIETYYLSVDGARTAMEVAARENATSQKSIADLGGMVQKIALNDRVRESVEFAVRVQNALVAGDGSPGARGRNRGVRRAPFIVLIGAKMPSILAEIGFLSNPHEEELLERTEYREEIAEALFAGIESYAKSLSVIQTASASPAPLPAVSAAAPPAKPGVVKKQAVAAATPTTAPVRRGNGPKPSPYRRRRASASN